MVHRAWNTLPSQWTTSRIADSAKGIVRPWLHTESPVHLRVIHTIEELDEQLVSIEKAAQISDDELRSSFDTFRMEITSDMPSDPFSDEYRIAVMKLYEWLHGSPYQLNNEQTDFEFSRFVRTPFPYSTHSCATVGNHLMAVGHAVKTLDIRPESRVLELGPGWGNATLALAQMGHQVTAVDMSQEFLRLIEARAEQIGAHVETVCGDFSCIDELQGQWDAVVFFESFHHSPDHLRLLERLHRIVAPDGKLLFASEPIVNDFYLPWGPRLDGESLWAIRTNGWLELGFRKSYFLEALRRTGWSAREVAHAGITPSATFVAMSR